MFRYLKFRNFSKNWEKYVVILNTVKIPWIFVDTAIFLALGKALNIYI